MFFNTFISDRYLRVKFIILFQQNKYKIYVNYVIKNKSVKN